MAFLVNEKQVLAKLIKCTDINKVVQKQKEISSVDKSTCTQQGHDELWSSKKRDSKRAN